MPRRCRRSATQRRARDGAGPQRQADEVREIGRRLVRNLTHAPFRSYSARAARLDPRRRGAAPLRRRADRPGAHRRRRHRGGRHRRPHRHHPARARHSRRSSARPACSAATRAGATVVVDGSAGLITLNPPRPASPPHAAPSPPSRGTGSGSAGCAACPRSRSTARRSTCRPISSCRSSCRWSRSPARAGSGCCAPNSCS